MKVLLVYPNLHGMNMLPQAIAVFTRLLKDAGHSVALFDTTNWIIPGEDDFDSDKLKEIQLNARPYDDSILRSDIRITDVFDDFNNVVESYCPNLIAVSVTEDLYPVAMSLLKSLKKRTAPVIMGGVFATFAPDKCLQNDEVDMVCVGEGESTLLELCDRMQHEKQYEDVQNLLVKTCRGIRINPLRLPEDMNNSPLPDMSLFDESRLYRPMQGRVWKMLPVETHRGCPYQCTYCNSPMQRKLYREQTGGRFFRKKSVGLIYRELRYYKSEINAEALYFWADTFMAYSEYEFDEFCEMYENILLPFYCQLRVEEIDEKRLDRLMRLGLFRVSLGIEHGNEDFRRRVLKREMTNELIVNNLKILNELGLPFSVNNIIGFPNETRELAMDTIELNRKIDADGINAYSYSPFHGTPLRKMAEDLGFCGKDLIARSLTKPTMLNMPQFPPSVIEGLRRCFVLYVKMPKDRWLEIEKAELFTDEGNHLWAMLREECSRLYM